MLILASLEKAAAPRPFELPLWRQPIRISNTPTPCATRSLRTAARAATQRANDFAGIRLPMHLEPKGFEVPTTACPLVCQRALLNGRAHRPRVVCENQARSTLPRWRHVHQCAVPEDDGLCAEPEAEAIFILSAKYGLLSPET